MPSQFVISDGLTLRVEDELLLLCARANADAETGARIESITTLQTKLIGITFISLRAATQ